MDTPILPPAFDCGLCNVIHPCHCSRVRYGCDVCIPPISVEASNILSRAVSQLPAVSEYGRRLGEPEPKPVRVPLVRYA